jgi:predicted acetyltransferase
MPETKIELLHAPTSLMPVIQNMARFYAYDLSKSCGHDGLHDWSFPENGLYEAIDFSKYWLPGCQPFIIRVNEELAGFALINKKGSSEDVDWNMGEFFIVGKFQGMGLGRRIAVELFEKFPGTWEVMQMLCNTPAIHFWEKIISDYTKGNFTQFKKLFPEPEPHDNLILRFRNRI